VTPYENVLGGSDYIGVAMGCSGCRCTIGQEKNWGGAEFMGISCKCTPPPRARVHPLGAEESFFIGRRGCGV